MASPTAETAVRDYLRYLKDPQSVQPDTAELEARLRDTDDPIERLQLHAELAQKMDIGPQLRSDFVTHAAAWAGEHGVGPQPFREEGVPDDVLREAGLIDGRRRAGRTRAPRVSREEVERAALSFRKNRTFTIRDVQDKSGGSPATVRAVINDLVEAGRLEEVGPDPEHRGPGRAAVLYRKL